jgi:hypothetical protein
MEFTQMNFRVSIFSLENGAEITLNLAPGIANILPPTKAVFLFRHNVNEREYCDDDDDDNNNNDGDDDD